MQDFGEEGVGSTWRIDASRTGKGARFAREIFCDARSNFSTDCIGNCPLFEQHDNNKNW